MIFRRFGLWGLVLGITLGTWCTSMAQDAAADAAKTEPAAAAPAVADAAPADGVAADATAAAPTLPDYFTGTNPEETDPSKPQPPPKWPDPTGGYAGYWTTPAGTAVGDGDPSGKTPKDLYDRIVHNLFSINMMWVLITGFLVMFMQAGFAMVETGLCRAKNSAHTIAMNFMIYPLGCLAFWGYGFAIGWGNWFNGPVPDGWYASLGPGLSVLNEGLGINSSEVTEPTDNVYTYGLMGTKGFFLNGVDDVSVMALFFFMMVFMDTTATIPTGSMCERWAWKNFLLYGLWVALPYCLYANWVWGGGWLAQMGKNWKLGHGAVDFAGSGVVHAMGGIIALAGAICIGPRVGKYKDGKPQPIPGHNVPMVIIGTFILAFGWFGFNPGSTLSGTDLRISVVVVNTMLAGVAAATGSHIVMSLKGLKPDPTMLCNGMLAGLVAITAPCAFVDSWAAVLIGGIAGALVVFSVFFWENMGVDDPCGAISVHGVNGTWGVLALGLFANGKYGLGFNGIERGVWDSAKRTWVEGDPAVLEDGVRGLFYGDSGQFFAQLISAGTVLAFGFVMAMVWFKVSNLITPLRVSKEMEVEGLDGPEMGVLGYPDFTLTHGSHG